MYPRRRPAPIKGPNRPTASLGESDAAKFECLCKPCYRAENHQPRDDLEGLLTETGAGDLDREAFLAWYCDRAGRGDRAEE